MSPPLPRPEPVPLWLRAWAVLTVLTALPLVLLGAEVTTKRFGMADEEGFRAPWFFFTLDLRNTPLNALVEHGHRLAGFAVGLCCIVLALGLTFSVKTWHRWLGWLALAAVGSQGILGILRVNLDLKAGPELAAFHGCFAQLAISALVGVAVLLSRSWNTPFVASPDVRQARRLAGVLVGVAYLQIVCGALMRHFFDRSAQRLHLLLAFLVVGLAIWLLRSLRDVTEDRVLRRVGNVLLGLLLFQPLLGVEAWMRKYTTFEAWASPSSPALDAVRSGHHLLGTLILGTTVTLLLLVARRTATESGAEGTPATEPVPLSRLYTAKRADEMEGAL